MTPMTITGDDPDDSSEHRNEAALQSSHFLRMYILFCKNCNFSKNITNNQRLKERYINLAVYLFRNLPDKYFLPNNSNIDQTIYVLPK